MIFFSFDKYFFNPSIWHKIISFLLLPFSFVYFSIAIWKKRFSKKIDFGIKIISIGNIVSGGSGKTPFCMDLVRRLEIEGYEDIFVVLRGYKRESKGLLIVNLRGELQTYKNEKIKAKYCGDESMMISERFISDNLKASVIVSEDREYGILKAKSLGAKIIILDDGFRFNFEKFDILLKPEIEPYFNFTLPSGYYRFPKSYYQKANLVLNDGVDFVREVKILHETKKMVLIVAIANPKRLDKYIENIKHFVIAKYYFPDHTLLKVKTLKKIKQYHDATSILVTQKDYVKYKRLDINFSIIDMNLKIKEHVFGSIFDYLGNHCRINYFSKRNYDQFFENDNKEMEIINCKSKIDSKEEVIKPQKIKPKNIKSHDAINSTTDLHDEINFKKRIYVESHENKQNIIKDRESKKFDI